MARSAGGCSSRRPSGPTTGRAPIREPSSTRLVLLPCLSQSARVSASSSTNTLALSPTAIRAGKRCRPPLPVQPNIFQRRCRRRRHDAHCNRPLPHPAIRGPTTVVFLKLVLTAGNGRDANCAYPGHSCSLQCGHITERLQGELHSLCFCHGIDFR